MASGGSARDRTVNHPLRRDRKLTLEGQDHSQQAQRLEAGNETS